MSDEAPYNPLDTKNLGKSVAEALLDRDDQDGPDTAADREADRREAALAVQAARTSNIDLADAAQAIAARRGDLAEAVRLAETPLDPAAENEPGDT